MGWSSAPWSAEPWSHAEVVAPPGAAVWPLPAQVLAGVVYGPTGAEYTGTLVCAGDAASIWNGVDLEAGLSPGDMLRVILAAVSGRSSGAGTR